MEPNYQEIDEDGNFSISFPGGASDSDYATGINSFLESSGAPQRLQVRDGVNMPDAGVDVPVLFATDESMESTGDVGSSLSTFPSFRTQPAPQQSFFGDFIARARDEINPLMAKRNMLYETQLNASLEAEQSRKPLITGLFSFLGSLAGGGSVGNAASAASNYGFLSLKNLRDEEVVKTKILGQQIKDLNTEIQTKETMVNRMLLEEGNVQSTFERDRVTGNQPGTPEFEERERGKNERANAQLALSLQRNQRAEQAQEDGDSQRKRAIAKDIMQGKLGGRLATVDAGKQIPAAQQTTILREIDAYERIKRFTLETQNVMQKYAAGMMTEPEASAYLKAYVAPIVTGIDITSKIGSALTGQEPALKLEPLMVQIASGASINSAMSVLEGDGRWRKLFAQTRDHRDQVEKVATQVKAIVDVVDTQRQMFLDSNGLFEVDNPKNDKEKARLQQIAAAEQFLIKDAEMFGAVAPTPQSTPSEAPSSSSGADVNQLRAEVEALRQRARELGIQQ